VAELGATLQVVRQGFGSASESATGFMALMTAITKNADKLKKAGVKVYDVGPGGVKRLRHVSTIVRDISRSKLMKDPTKLGKALGGRGEAVRALQVIIKGRGEVEALTKAGLESNAVQEDFLSFQASGVARMERAWERLKNKILEAVTPERIEKFAGAMEKVAGIVAFLADNIVTVGAGLLALKVGPAITSLISLTRELRAAGGLRKLLQTGGGVGAAGKEFGAAAAFALGVGIGQYIDEKLGISESLGDTGEIDLTTVAGKRQQAALNAQGKVRRQKEQDTGDRLWGFTKGVGVGGVAGALQPEHQRFEDVEVAEGYREALKLRSKQLYAEAAEQERQERLARVGAAVEAKQATAAEQQRLGKIALDVNVKVDDGLKATVDQERKGRNRR
jgi:hypothetical protein